MWLPIRIRTAADEGLAVTYDLSEKGVLIFTTAALAVGTRVTLTFDVPGEDRTVVSTGAVVHTSPNDADPDGLWRHRVGIELDQVVGEFRALIERLADLAPVSRR